MSDIPYPHRVSVYRPAQAVEEDDYGRPIVEHALLTTIPAWVQTKTSRSAAAFQQAAQGQPISGSGISPTTSTHTVFVDPFDFKPGDYLVTVPGGGIGSFTKHKIVGIRNPDEGVDHLEIDTRVRGLLEPS